MFIGTPNWFKTLAPPVMSFMKQYDFEGETLPGIAVNGAVVPEEIQAWLESIGL